MHGGAGVGARAYHFAPWDDRRKIGKTHFRLRFVKRGGCVDFLGMRSSTRGLRVGAYELLP